MADRNSQVNFSDGEAIDFGDWERLQALLLNKIHRQPLTSDGMGEAQNFGHTTGSGDTGGAMPVLQPGIGGSPSIPDGIMVPNPTGFYFEQFDVNGAGLLTFSLWAQTFAQRSIAGTPGVAPSGFDQILVHTLGEEVAALTAAVPVTNDRIDSIGFRLGHAKSNPEVRDFQDEVSRALTTTATDKDQEVTFEKELIQGVEAPSPATPAHTAGFGRFLTILREPGETSLNPDNVELHAWPLKLKTETIWAKDMYFDPATFSEDGPLNFEVRRSAVGGGLGVGGLIGLSSQMHEGHRLVGVGVGFNEQVDDALSIRLIRYQISAAGVATEVELQELGGPGSVLSSAANLGFQFAGVQDFDAPYWGNGHKRGPLLSNLGANPMRTVSTSQIGITIGGPGGAPWVIGGGLHFVRFYYLE